MVDEEVILLGFELSPFVGRAKIALHEKGVKFEYKEQDLRNKSPLLVQMNPVHKLVPVLIHNGNSVCESDNIVQYINEVWNHVSPLIPTDPYQRAHARFWVDYINKKIFPFGKMLWLSKGETREAARNELIQSFKTLEEELGEKPYFAGESFGFVDLSLIPFQNIFYTFETLGNWSMEVDCPKIVSWAKRCLMRESVAKSLSDQQKIYQHILKVKRKIVGDDVDYLRSRI